MIETEVRLFEALGNEIRLRILILLAHKELCGCQLEWALGMTQAKISRHLTVLRNAALINERREGLWIFYSLARPKNELEGDIQKNLKSYFMKKYDSIKMDLQNMKKCTNKPLKKLNTIRILPQASLKGTYK